MSSYIFWGALTSTVGADRGLWLWRVVCGLWLWLVVVAVAVAAAVVVAIIVAVARGCGCCGCGGGLWQRLLLVVVARGYGGCWWMGFVPGALGGREAGECNGR